MRVLAESADGFSVQDLPIGEKGDTGPQGVPGPKGDKGDPGTGVGVDPTWVANVNQQLQDRQNNANDHGAAIAEAQTYIWNFRDRIAALETDVAAIKTSGVGGAVTGRGYRYLDEFTGTTPADKLRNAWAATNQAIVPMPGTVIDVGSNPITITAGKVLMGLGGGQNEFSASWPVYVKAAAGGSVFKVADNGTNYNGNKGWGLKDIGFEGQSGIYFIQPCTLTNTINYAQIDGCSFDTFKTVIDAPMLGVKIMGNSYTNNIFGDFGYRIKGSDNDLWNNGALMDFGGQGKNPAATMLLVESLQKTNIGGIYITGDPARALKCSGGASNDGVNFVGARFEGRNAGAPSAGAVVKIEGGGYNFVGCQFNYAVPGRSESGTVMISGGDASFTGARFRRASAQGAPDVYQTGGIVDISGARLVNTGDHRITYKKTGGTVYNDGTVNVTA
jgi:hypothetical protein